MRAARWFLIVMVWTLVTGPFASTTVAAQSYEGRTNETAGYIRGHGVWLPGTRLGVPSSAPEDARTVVSVVNNNLGVVNSGPGNTVSFDLDALIASPLDGKPYSAIELRFAVDVLAKLQGARFRSVSPGDIGIRATWYDYVKLGTYHTEWTDVTHYPSTRTYYPYENIAF